MSKLCFDVFLIKDLALDSHYFHFLCLPKENETKEKALFSRYFFRLRRKNQICFAKIFPRLQDFLTQNKSYTGEKRFSKLCFGTSNLPLE
ncbi:hypothetical protein [Aquimarina sp. MMG016]|uniref:hypothetical protein n=1 Tax=Aquimarina sp. MMG016 TaxID=2822690 RepID=UPI001B39CE80|nr:hypothetical protein [Aquimarina sp. MMG016]MBQ4821521.1 hypothetical protein [Aquimarina sp. MMG016]